MLTKGDNCSPELHLIKFKPDFVSPRTTN